MSQASFGKRYFAIRGKMAGIMAETKALASETATDLTSTLPALPPGEDEDEPFRILALGEVNAGKSSLLNELAGIDLCPVQRLPETRKIHFYRYGPTPASQPFASHTSLESRPIPLLRDVQLIDTPGANAANTEWQEFLPALCQQADLILLVFPVTNPWGAAGWNLLAAMETEALARTVIVVQQADLRETKDLAVIHGHMTSLARQRAGTVPPIFPISALQAREARLAHPEAPPRAGGLQALDDFITREVCLKPERIDRLNLWLRQAARALQTVERRLEEQTRGLRDQGAFLEGLETEIETLRDSFLANLPTHLAHVAAVFGREAEDSTRLLRKRLGAGRSMLRVFLGDETSRHVEARFIEGLRRAVGDVAGQGADQAAAACLHHWDQMAIRVKQTVGVDLHQNGGRPDAALQAACQHFVSQLTHAASQAIGQVKVRHNLEKNLRLRNRSLKAFLACALSAFTAAGITGGLQQPEWLSLGLLGLGILFLTGGCLVAWATKRAIREDFLSHLNSTCGQFATLLQNDWSLELARVFKQYAGCLQDLRGHIAAGEKAHQPRQQRWKQCFLALKALEQEW